MSYVNITTAVPCGKKKEMRGKIVDRTIEEVGFYFVEAEAAGFKAGVGAVAKRVWTGNSPLRYLWVTSDVGGTVVRRSRLLFRQKDELNELKVPSVPDGGSDTTFTVNVTVRDKSGAKARDSCSVRVHRRFEIERRSDLDKDSPNHNPDIEAVSAPFPGGESGVTLSVTETSAFQRERTWSVSQNAGFNIEVPVNVIKIGYGLEVTKEFSSSIAVEQQKQSGVQAQVPPDKYGIWYRKIQPYERHADVYMLDESGGRENVGSIVLIDYLVSYHLGIGSTEQDAHQAARKHLSPRKAV